MTQTCKDEVSSFLSGAIIQEVARITCSLCKERRYTPGPELKKPYPNGMIRLFLLPQDIAARTKSIAIRLKIDFGSRVR